MNLYANRVELIYDADCPNVAAARCLLIQAFARTGVSARWCEWERGAPESSNAALGETRTSANCARRVSDPLSDRSRGRHSAARDVS